MVRVAGTALGLFIERNEVLTSTDLVNRLVHRHRLTPAAARQRVFRTLNTADIWRSTNIVLPGRSRLFAQRHFVGKAEFYDTVAAVLATTRPGLSRCLRALANDQIIHEVQAQKLLAAPAAGKLTGNYPGLDRDFSALTELGVTITRVGSHQFLSRRRSSLTLKDAAAPLSLLRRESLLTRLVVNRLKKENVVSWSGSHLPSLERLATEFSGQVFSAFGFSFLRPLRRRPADGGESKPCPVLLDVHGGLSGTEVVESFLQRAHRATSKRGSSTPFLGVIAARSFTDEAWKRARSEGLIAMNLVQVFGDQALEAMVVAERLLGGFDVEPASEDYTQLVRSIRKLKANPVIADLCSIGFEAFAGMVLRDQRYELVTMGTNVPFGTTTRDVDVHGTGADEVVVVECKAYHEKKFVDFSEIKKFFTETVPSFVKWWSARNDNRTPSKVRAEFWTTGRFYHDAEEKLAALALKKNVVPALVTREQLEANLSSRVRMRGVSLLSAIAQSGEADDEGEQVLGQAAVSLEGWTVTHGS